MRQRNDFVAREELAPPALDGTGLHEMSQPPLGGGGGITILGGSLCPEGAVVKAAGLATSEFTGTARVFDRERGALDALEDGTITAGTSW